MSDQTKPKQLGVKRDVEGSDHVRIFHCRIKLAGKGLPILHNHVSELSNMIYLREQQLLRQQSESTGRDVMIMGALMGTTQEEHAIVQAVRDLDGVEYVLAAGYHLVVCKGQQFDWSEVEPHVIRMMRTFHLALPDPTITEK